ncbi:heavy-metal-associated domain-containing protein [Siccirubricoccus phaeus]|uniref:heavy-metal-associated domain-containing protein n=1 Tax=Siccirubricoccus phaeus TaxID=2595053 RepID=UPI0011F2ABB0|nr:heavy-metal-associated domain-containing protein [Siccirubricoccus phaeus]
MVVFRIAGMRCGGCVRRVTAALRGVEPGAEVQVDLQRREVTVTGTAEADGLARALREAGYPGERLDS